MYISRWIYLSWVDTILKIGRFQNNWGVGGSGSPNFSLTPNFGQLLTWEMYFCFLRKVDFFKISLSTTHQIERIKVRNSQNFLWRGSPSPLPRPLLHSFSGFALHSGFALKSRTLCVLDSGVAQFAPNF